MATTFYPIETDASVYQPNHRRLHTLVMSHLSHNAGQVRDQPPPYRSPSPEKRGNDIALWARNKIIAETEELVSGPLSEQELRLTQTHFETWHSAYDPGRRYQVEATKDWLFETRHDPGLRDPKLRDLLLAGRAGKELEDVLIRHRIKKRWEQLGVWNPEWGIPNRVNGGPRDQENSWKWRWQGNTPYYGADYKEYIPHHPNSRAIHLREGLRRGARDPLPPRQHNIAADASKSAAESFITSRPWYTYEMDLEEEKTRLDRIPLDNRELFNLDHEKNVRKWWGENSGGTKGRYGWKWSHESPSPEPENLSEMDFTPSEIDALEAIPPPTPPQSSPSRQRSVRWLVVHGPDNQKISKFIYPPEPKAFTPESEPEAIAPEADVAELRKEFRPSPPQQKPRGRMAKLSPSTHKAASLATHGDATKPSKVRLRRSARIARIAKRSRQLEVAAAQTNPVKATRPRKGVSRPRYF